MGYKAVATRFQFGASLGIVEELPIEHHKHAPVFVGDRLLPIRQPNDTEPPRSQGKTRTLKVTLLIGTAVKYCPCHRSYEPLLYGSVPGQIHDTSDAAH
jgi:hypothetical protein